MVADGKVGDMLSLLVKSILSQSSVLRWTFARMRSSLTPYWMPAYISRMSRASKQDESCNVLPVEVVSNLQDTRRLSWILRDFEAATLLPTVQNYGLIIKARKVVQTASGAIGSCDVVCVCVLARLTPASSRRESAGPAGMR